MPGSFFGSGAVSSVAGRSGVVVLTKADVGLGNLTNAAQVLRTEMGAASGVATLDSSGKLDAAQIPAISVGAFLGVVSSQAAMLALTGANGSWVSRSDTGTIFVLNAQPASTLGNWTELSYPTAPVLSVSGKTGSVSLTFSDLGGNVATGQFNGGTAATSATFWRGDGTWATPQSDIAAASLWTTKGDMAIATGNATAARLAVGANGAVLLSDSTATSGIKWGPLPITSIANYATSTLALTDPNADRIAFWDDSSGHFDWLSTSNQFVVTGTTFGVRTPTQLGSQREVWLSLRGDGVEGTGTENDPFDATGSSFDTVMADITKTPTNTIIHLKPGTYTTAVATADGTAFNFRDGWRIIGAGMYRTTIQMTGNVAGQHYDHQAFKTTGVNTASKIVISDLTVDCNQAAIAPTADLSVSERNVVLYAVAISGDNNVVERVRCINQYGSFNNGSESFGILLAGATSNVIRFCVCETPGGSYGSPFAFNGASTTAPLRNSKGHDNLAVGLNNGIGQPFNSGGFNVAYVEDCEFYNNKFVDCIGAVYCDTGSANRLKIHGNSVVRGWKGVAFVSDEGAQPTWTKQNIEVFGNDIQLQDRTGGENAAIRFANGTNIKIGPNTITTTTGGVGTGTLWTVLMQSLTNVTVCDLTAPNTIAQVTGTGINIARNRSITGTVLTGLEDSNTTNLQTVLAAKDNTNGSLWDQLVIEDTTAYNSSPIAGIAFGGYYNTAPNLATWGGVSSGKENATSGNYAGYMALHTRANGQNIAEVLRLGSDAGVNIGGTTNVGASNLRVGGLTASRLVATDASKVLSSVSFATTDIARVSQTNTFSGTNSFSGSLALPDFLWITDAHSLERIYFDLAGNGGTTYIKSGGTDVVLRKSDDTVLATFSNGALTLPSTLTLGTTTSAITGAAGNMTLTAGTGNSRTMTLRTTTSGGTATAALTLGADQSAAFNGVARLKGYTVSTLPTGTTGDNACVTDGDPALAWGATVVNSGSGTTPYRVWFNGTNWTVTGK